MWSWRHFAWLAEKLEPQDVKANLQGTLAVLRDDLGRADTMLVTADKLIEQVWSGEGEGGTGDTLTRRRNHVSYLLEADRLAVRAAMRAGDEIDLHPGGGDV
jgi:hypothetical protein